MLIRTFGLFWDREHVEWGAGRRPGHLNGYYPYAKREGITDFRYQKGVYCLYDSTFRIVYVGQAGNGNACLFDRLKTHTRDHLAERWSRFSWFGTRGVEYDDAQECFVLAEDQDFNPVLRDVLNQIEGIIIATAEPPLNKQGSRFGDSVYPYNQVKRAP